MIRATNLICNGPPLLRKTHRTMSADFWAGYISGATGIVIGNPLDLIKVRLQAGERIATRPGGFVGQFESVGTLVKGR